MDVTKLLETSLTLDVVKSSPSKKGVILSGGTMQAMQDGKQKMCLLVEIDGKQLNWYPNKTSMKFVAGAYGNESNGWIGKPFTVDIGIVNGKEATIVKPVQQTLAQPVQQTPVQPVNQNDVIVETIKPNP